MSDDDERDLPGPVLAELTRLRAERDVSAHRQERLQVELREAQLEARELAKHRDELVQDAAVAGDLRARAEKTDALAHNLAVSRTERDTLRAELAGCRTERDRLRVQLLEAEELLAAVADTDAQLREQQTPMPKRAENARLAEAEQRAAEFGRELDATRRTVSWRVTAPLRAVRRRVGRR